MEIEQVRGEAFAVPLTNPAFPPGAYRFINREFKSRADRLTTFVVAVACRRNV